MERIPPGQGQESVWDYPRPPRVEPEERPVRIVLGGRTIATSLQAMRVLETSHPPGIYVPASDFVDGAVRPSAARSTVCEWKGRARYFDLVTREVVARGAAWSYPDPRPGYEAIAGHISVYPGRVDGCYLGDELVEAQEGGFYGGWITNDVVGPFKGAPGTLGW